MALATAKLIETTRLLLGEDKTPNAWILQGLNFAYRKVVRTLPNHFLNELQVLESDLPLDTNGKYDLGNLSNTIYDKHRGIVIARFKDGYPSSLVSRQEVEDFYQEDDTPDSDHPCHFPWGDVLEFWPKTTVDDVATGSLVVGTTYYNFGYTKVTYNGSDYTDTESFVCVTGTGTLTYTTTGTGTVGAAPQLIDLYYKKDPTDMVEGGQACLLSDELRDIICKIACGTKNIDEYNLGGKLLDELKKSAPATDSNRLGIDPLQDRTRGIPDQGKPPKWYYR